MRDKYLENTLSAMRVSGTPNSRPAIPVHFPVPFCPAASLIFSKR